MIFASICHGIYFPLHRLLVMCVILPLFCVSPAVAGPDFTASEIKVENEPVLEGGVAHFKVVMRNRGDAPADPAQLRIEWPLMGHLVEVKGLSEAQTNHDEREITASVSLPPGGERTVEVFVLAPRDSGGDALSVSAKLVHYHTMAETWFHQTTTIDTRIPQDGLLIGGLRITPAGLATVVWLVLAALALVIVSLKGGSGGFFGPRAGVLAVMIAIGFWLIFAAMAWRDYRVLYQWKETTGRIIGRRVVTQTVSNSQSRTTGSGYQTRSSDVSKPEFALRYTADGREMLSTGYDTGSSLRVGGGRAQLEKEFLEWTVGAQVPCWYDPRDPSDVVVKRGFGGAYVFSLLPLLPFWMGVAILRNRKS